MKILTVLVVLVLVASVAFMLRPGFGSFERWFAPGAQIWMKWQSHNAASKADLDHSDWSNFLEKYLSHSKHGVALVDYSAVTSEDRAVLESYIQRLSKVRVSHQL